MATGNLLEFAVNVQTKLETMQCVKTFYLNVAAVIWKTVLKRGCAWKLLCGYCEALAHQ